MEQPNSIIPNDNSDNRKDLEPGRGDRNLFSDDRSEAPIDQDLPTNATNSMEAGDETYEDEEMEDPDYYEKRAGDDVRK